MSASADPIAELELRRAVHDDAPAMRAYALRNAAHLAPWEPLRGPESLEVETIAARLGGDDRIQFLALHAGELVGQAALSNFARVPVFLNCTLGYSVDEQWQGRGVASALVEHAVREAFDVERLHRVEAGTLLDNAASQRVLEKCGFERIGVSRRHVRIAGRWQDHVLYAITAESLGERG